MVVDTQTDMLYWIEVLRMSPGSAANSREDRARRVLSRIASLRDDSRKIERGASRRVAARTEPTFQRPRPPLRDAAACRPALDRTVRQDRGIANGVYTMKLSTALGACTQDDACAEQFVQLVTTKWLAGVWDAQTLLAADTDNAAVLAMTLDGDGSVASERAVASAVATLRCVGYYDSAVASTAAAARSRR